MIHGFILLQLILAGRIVSAHFETPCSFLTWARWPQPRDRQHTEGLPGLADLQQQQLVETGNDLAALLLVVALLCMNRVPTVVWKILSYSGCGYYLMSACFLQTRVFNSLRDCMRISGFPSKPTPFLHIAPTLHRLQEPVRPGQVRPLSSGAKCSLKVPGCSAPSLGNPTLLPWVPGMANSWPRH